MFPYNFNHRLYNLKYQKSETSSTRPRVGLTLSLLGSVSDESRVILKFILIHIFSVSASFIVDIKFCTSLPSCFPVR